MPNHLSLSIRPGEASEGSIHGIKNVKEPRDFSSLMGEGHCVIHIAEATQQLLFTINVDDMLW